MRLWVSERNKTQCGAARLPGERAAQWASGSEPVMYWSQSVRCRFFHVLSRRKPGLPPTMTGSRVHRIS